MASLGVPCTSCPVAIALIFLARPSFHSRLEHSYTLTQNLGLGLLAPEQCLKSIQAPLRLLRQNLESRDRHSLSRGKMQEYM